MRSTIVIDAVAEEASIYLTKADRALASTIVWVGICPIRPHANYHQELVEAIIGQQLSVKAAYVHDLAQHIQDGQ